MTTAPPEGVVTLLFTDIEGSTKLLQRLGDEYPIALAQHRALLRDAFVANDGFEVDTQGDSFFVVFPSAQGAIAAAVAGQRALRDAAWPKDERVNVRMGLHTGTPILIDDNYVGIDVHRGARIGAVAHGGQIVVSDVTVADVAEPSEFQFRELGEHRLKDLEDPETILQVEVPDLPQAFPPLRSLRPETNVPRSLGDLVGREREKAELATLLAGQEKRLVTILGPGGTGKTRLAAAIALEALDHFPSGVFFVDLTNLSSREQIGSAIADTLGVIPEDAVAGVIDHISHKRILLLLDNFEHAVSAAGVVAELLGACPSLHVIATSRIALGIGGEVGYPLDPLSPPHERTLAAVEASPAGALFLERARAARPDFELSASSADAVWRICHLLDGLPLALELAAAKLKLLSVEQLVDRLSDRFKILKGGKAEAPERHQTLRATIDWSYELLTSDERDLFKTFSVFSGGATLETLEGVVGEDILDPLGVLVNHSLVRQRTSDSGAIRFSMLGTIREYGLELLDADPEADRVRDRHATYFAHAFLDTADRHAAMSFAGTEIDNLREALVHLAASIPEGGDAQRELFGRLSAGLGPYWYRHGMASEGSEWLQRALDVAPSGSDDVRAALFRRLGILMDQQRRLQEAAALLSKALALYRDLRDPEGEASCLNSLGVVQRNRDQLDSAESFLRKSILLRKRLGDPAMASSLVNLGIVEMDRGQWELAQSLFEEALGIDRATGDRWGAMATTNNLAAVKIELGELEAAQEYVTESLRGFADLEEYEGLAESLEIFGGLASHQGEPQRAGRLVGAAAGLRREISVPLSQADRKMVDRWMLPAIEKLGREGFERAVQEGERMTRDQAVRVALRFEGAERG